jgi:non-heme chloroperoxidase
MPDPNTSPLLKKEHAMSKEEDTILPISRRQALLAGAGLAALATTALLPEAAVAADSPSADHMQYMMGGNTVSATDGTKIFYRDSGGAGQPIVFSHGWPLSGQAWEAQMLFLYMHGYRVIAVDRRGHGNSGATATGNDMDHYGNDLASVIDTLDLKSAILVGHSTGGGEVTRYIGRHGNKRVAKVVLISAVTPIMLKTPTHPNGLPIEVFDGIRAGVAGIRSQFYLDLAMPFFGFNRPGAKVSQGLINDFYRLGMQSNIKASYDCIKAFSETDLSADLQRITVPTLFMHGDDDQIVPIDLSARVAVKLVKNATLKVYPGAPHGMPMTMSDTINTDLLAFIKS